ncbi:MAG: ribonuclease E/G [Actinomycetota bacterium]|nr:Rne/Rng family ribonuclease [Actinomycetota bacterium]
MLITVGSERNQIGILDKRELVEHYVAHNEEQSLVGNIYMGRVQNVLPGMEAAFLDIGEARNAVLYAGEVSFDEEVDGPTPRIEAMLKSGQPVLAQVTKDPMGSKGARLTTEVSIAGRYLVLVPSADFVGISRRLPDDERKRLRDITAQLRPDGLGLIVRTAAEGATEQDLQRDVARLVRIWNEVSEASKKAKPPKLIHGEPELVIRVVRDLLTSDFERVVVDDEAVFARIKDYIGEVTPELADKMELYSEELPLFERYHVVEQIRKAIDRKVWLKSGGHIVIDRTEAMTVVDVNTGRFVGKSNLEETVLQANLEAAQEVAKQLRLRDIGGIIVIDFIDMMYERNRDELLNTFKDALQADKTRTQVFGVSELGLVQMTRKKVSEGLLEAFSEPCDKCAGRGIILTDMD